MSEGSPPERLPPRHVQLLQRVQWSWWANLFFFFGSGVYVITALPVPWICWWWNAEDNFSCNFLNWMAAWLFIIDALFYMVDDYVLVFAPPTERRERPTSTFQALQYDAASAVRHWNLLYWSNLVFLIASVLYLCTASLWWWFPEREFEYFLVDMFASHTFVIDSAMLLVEWWSVRVITQPLERKKWLLFRLSDLEYYDWNGLGDWMFFFGSILYAIGSWYGQYGADKQYEWEVLELLAAVLFVADAVFYAIGYECADRVKRREEQAEGHVGAPSPALPVTLQAEDLPTALDTPKQAAQSLDAVHEAQEVVEGTVEGVEGPVEVHINVPV